MLDVIGNLAGVAPGSALDVLRDRRPQARLHSQASYDALFSPDDTSGISVVERHAVAAFVAGLHGQAEIAGFYGAGLVPDLRRAIADAASAAATHGPYGDYPPGPLTAENVAGPSLPMPDAAILGTRLPAALAHAHMLVFHPRDAAAPALQALLDAGWVTTAIVTLSQLVAFLSYQIRVATGLRVLAAHPVEPKP